MQVLASGLNDPSFNVPYYRVSPMSAAASALPLYQWNKTNVTSRSGSPMAPPDTTTSSSVQTASTIRALALTPAAPRDLGAMNWRSIAPTRPVGVTGLQMHLGDSCTFGLVPMGAGRTYGFAYVIQPRFHDPLVGRLERLRKRFAEFGGRVQEYMASLERDDQVICSAMEWMELDAYYSGRVVLVGDAAHASSPMMGQGGCMAMEDACVLAEELSSSTSTEIALARYVDRRKPRVEWVQRQSITVGDSLALPSAARNAALRQHGDEAMRVRFGPLVKSP
jgi:2-polyprenyl-6-methoxyphenol hydroxylase-like FAD-dependent oxidoreductase